MSDLTASDILNGTHAPVKNGKIEQPTASTDKEKEVKANGGALDKDAFLQLLVTQMKYQDPLEPTDNTEYVSQLATFSSLEEMQNMSASMDKSRASSLVGQYVYITTTESTGNTKNVEGLVDYVSFQGNKTFLSVNGSLYNIDELTSVADSEYTLATQLAQALSVKLNELPAVERLNIADKDAVLEVMATYGNMNSYQKSFLSDEDLKLYSKYADWYVKTFGEQKADE